MEIDGYDVIDVHQHYDTSLVLDDAATERAHRLKIMDAQKVRGAVVLASNGYLRPRGLADTAAANDAIAAYRDHQPDRFVAAVGVIEPIYGPAGYAEVARCRDELGLAGIGFHNGQQGMPIDSPLMRRLLEKMGEANLVPFVHALGNDLETIWQVDLLARDLPDLPMVVMDVFHDINQMKSLPDIAERRPNLYFDLSLSVSFHFMGLPTVRAVGAERFLYGTDFYSLPTMPHPFGTLLPDILGCDLSVHEKEAILSGNITRILGLKARAPAAPSGT